MTRKRQQAVQQRGKSAGEGSGKKAGVLRMLFDDLSISQLAAGALAAVTSMLLSSSIGIAGSVVGVAAGSIVSAVSSQLYKKFLAASAEKILEIPVVANVVPGAAAATSKAHATQAQGSLTSPEALSAPGDATHAPVAQEHAAERASRVGKASDDELLGAQAPHVRLPDESDETAELSFAAATGVAEAAEDGGAENAAGGAGAAGAAGAARGARGARGAEAVASAQGDHRHHRVLAVAVASSLVGVLLAAGAVLLFTGGEGLGEKPEPVLSSLSRPSAASSANDAASSAGADASAGVSSSASADSSSSASDSGGEADDAADGDDKSDTAGDKDESGEQNGSGGSSSEGDSGGAGSSDAGSDAGGTGGTDAGDTSAGGASGAGGAGSGSTSAGGTSASDTNAGSSGGAGSAGAGGASASDKDASGTSGAGSSGGALRSGARSSTGTSAVSAHVLASF